MARATEPRTAVERLVDRLFDGDDGDPMAGELTAWLADSARFRTFVTEHNDKIRKKLRGAADEPSRRDVRAELRAAHLLLADRRLDLAFEAYGSGKVGPDFTVTLRGERPFNLEVTRLRRTPAEAGSGGPLLTKLRQLPPSAPNVLLVAVEGDTAEALDVTAITRGLRARADRKDESFFVDRGFDGTRGFYERFLRLSAVLVWCEGARGDARASAWINRSARIAVPEPAWRACVGCLRAG